MSSTKLISTRISCFTFLAYKTTCKFKKNIFKFHSAFLFSKLTKFENFRNFFITTKNKNTDLLEHHHQDTKVQCLLLSLLVHAFHASHFLHTKRHVSPEKTYSNFTQHFYFPNSPTWKTFENFLLQQKTKILTFWNSITKTRKFLVYH